MAETYSSGVWTAKEGEDEAFVEAWTEFARWLSTMPGAGTARLTRTVGAPQRYLSFASWESADALDAWRSDPEFSRRIAAVREHVTDFTPSEYELVAQVQG